MLLGRPFRGRNAPGYKQEPSRIRTMKTIQDMKNELRATLLITDENKRPETLMRLTLLWGLSKEPCHYLAPRLVTRKARGLSSRHLQTPRSYQSIAVEASKHSPFVAIPKGIMDVSSDGSDHRSAIRGIGACARRCYGWIVAYSPKSGVDRCHRCSTDCSCGDDSEKRMSNLVAHMGDSLLMRY
jgi:hypothetical protein